MAHDEGGACVYVKASVLHELEQERRRLKWQLSRALQTSDTRAAELEASEAKVKDLLTIVEVNKSVVDHVVQRSHGRDVQRRAELETLHQQNKQQRQRYVELAMQLMNRRVRDRQQRDAFHLLQHAVQLQSRRREVLLRLHARLRRRILRQRLQRWKHFCSLNEYGIAASCSTESAKVHPVLQQQLHAIVSQAAFMTEPRLPQTRPTGAKKLGNDNSKQFLRWQLLRKVWRDWERVVRWKRKHREFVKIASERLLRFIFVAWRSRVRTLRKSRVLLRRALARTNRRLQQRGLTSLRLRCAEVAAHDWAKVLKTAHAAMEEERTLRAEVQSSVASELHTTYIREQQRHQRFTVLQTQRLQDFSRRGCKQRALMILRCKVIQSRHKNAIALRFQRLQHRQRVIRRLFTAWKHCVDRSTHIKTMTAAWDARRVHSIKGNCFRLFAWTLQRRRQRRRRLSALISRPRKTWLMRGWLCLRIRSAIEEHKAIAYVEMWQLSQHVEAVQAACKEDVRRSRKVAFKYQLTCALFRGDKKRESMLGAVLRSWSRWTTASTRQRRTLRRILARRRVAALRAAVHKWIHLNEYEAARWNQLELYQVSRCHRAVEAAFEMWKRNTHDKLRLRLAKYQQRSCFRAWRQWHHLKQQRAQWFGRFLKRSMERWQRQAFKLWKLKQDHYVKVYIRREHAEHELISRLWRRWIGFVSSRLHKQHIQQQRALSGVRGALQRTILSTAFLSWQAHWRRNQQREKLIVRACRRNAGLARRRRYLQAWHQHSARMARRRTALRRICRRQSLRRLQCEWHRWIRASHTAMITRLKAASIKAQQQVGSVVQSTSKINLLRRTIRKWKIIVTEAKEQQRRRDLFAEKRRYMMLQATLRHWQRRITCSPLTKQHRMVQHLLNKLQQSAERRAFRHWERWSHKKTLTQRDRISAELFRRSETRVMALVEEVRAERERRIVFTSWRSIAARKKKAGKSLRGILLKGQRRLLQSSWTIWIGYTQTQRCIVRLIEMIDQRRKAAAWHKLMQMYHRHDLRSSGARRAGVIWHKTLVRHAWNHWKRVDSFLAKHAALTEVRTSSTQSMLAFKKTIARRNHRKRFLILVFKAWKQVVVCTKRLRHHLCDALGRQVEATTAYHFQKWRKLAEQQNYLQERLYRVMRRQQARNLRFALSCWRWWTLEVAHRMQLEQTKRAMSHQREESAKRIAVVKFLAWQRPCLEAHFVRWKVHVEQRRRYVVEQRIALSHRQTRHLLQSVWRTWYDAVYQSKRRADLLTKTLNKTRIALLAHGFHRWDQWRRWMLDVDDSAIRLVRIHELWQWRRGFSALRQHHHEAIRRQSVKAATAFSVHSARQREHQNQMMRAVALVLQRKTSAALCDRCLRHWIIYLKAKAKTKSMVKLARVRSQKRVIHRCFLAWQLFTRQNVVLQQKICRRQETWQCRRQRQIWNAWVFFTQHSLDVKQSIYDRVVIGALRHSLQGAWGRWKGHTKHANGLLDAQRVAQWEHAAAERDTVMSTLEDKHERLFLRAAQLGQQNNALRQRLVTSAAGKIHRVFELGYKSRVATAFEVWKHKLRQVSALETRMTALGLRYQYLALHRWHFTTYHLRASEEIKRVQLEATEWAARVVHTCAMQWLKRRSFITWKALVRTRRGIKRHLAAAQRRHEHKLVQCCWASWKLVLDARARQHAAVSALQARREIKTVLQTYWRWRSTHERFGFAKLNAVRTLLLLRRQWQRRLVVEGWNRWKTFTIEEGAELLHTKLASAKLEHEKAGDRHTRSQLLLRTFSNWKMYARSQCERRKGSVRALAATSRRRLLRCHLECWKRRTAWTQTRSLLLRRMERHLRRHYMALTKFAVWVWFSRALAGSRTLTTQLQVASKQFTPATDVSARIARALFTDLLLAERQLLRLKQRSAWRLVNATVRSAHRRMLRAAFDSLAGGVAVRTQRHFLTQMHVANARAFVDKLVLVLLRSGFQRWKQQYVALAIQEAEEAQQELLRALHHVTSYRQALDPYTKQS